MTQVILYIAGDCLEMGRISYLIGADDYAVDWLRESLRRYALEEHKTADKEDILQYYAFAAYKQGINKEYSTINFVKNTF